MTTTDVHRLRIADPAQLISALPSLIGFHPVESLVLTCLQGKRVGLTMRVDLPRTVEHWDLILDQLLPPLETTDPSAVLLTVVSRAPALDPGASLPFLDFVDFVVDTLSAEGIHVGHAVWTSSTSAHARWECYDQDPGCHGTVPDPSTSAVAAATVAAGRVVFASRDDVEALLTPDASKKMLRREGLLELKDREHPYDVVAAQQRFQMMSGLLAPVRVGMLHLDDERIAAAGSALLDLRVRDACLTWSLGEDAPAAERLWTALVRAMPRSHRADPAVLLAATAYLRGEGGLAGVALEVANGAWPGHTFAGLLRSALSGGIAPERLRGAMEAAREDAVLDLDLEEA